MTAIKRWPGFRKAHIEVRGSTGKAASDYCKKDGFFYEWGVLRNPLNGPLARKHAYELFYKKVLEGATDLQLIDHDAQLFTQCTRQIDRLRMQNRPTCDVKREVILYYGDTDLGKTRAVFEEYPDCYEVNVDHTTWYDGYVGQETVLFDEFSGEMRLEQAKKVFDNWYVRARPIKYGHTWFNPRRIILTSNHHPSTWWDFINRHKRVDEAAMRRRFTSIYQFERTLLGNVIRRQVDIDTFWPLGIYPRPRTDVLRTSKGTTYSADSRSGLFENGPPSLEAELSERTVSYSSPFCGDGESSSDFTLIEL